MGNVIRVAKFHQTERRIQPRYEGGIDNVIVLPVVHFTDGCRVPRFKLGKKYGLGSAPRLIGGDR